MGNQQQQGEGPGVGRGKSLDEAVRDAYVKLERRGSKPPFRIDEIWAEGTNPFSGYRVVLRS